MGTESGGWLRTPLWLSSFGSLLGLELGDVAVWPGKVSSSSAGAGMVAKTLNKGMACKVPEIQIVTRAIGENSPASLPLQRDFHKGGHDATVTPEITAASRPSQMCVGREEARNRQKRK